MLLIAQGVDDVQPWGRRREGRDLGMCVGANHEGWNPAFKVSRDILERLASAVGELRRKIQRVTAELVDGHFERGARPKRRFLEQHGHVPSLKCMRGRRLEGQMSVRFQLRGQVEQPDRGCGSTDRGWRENPCPASPGVLPGSCSIFAVDANVLGAQVAGPDRR